MKFYKCLSVFILIFFLASACTLQKRAYRKGYYLHWRHANPPVAKSNPEKNILSAEASTSKSLSDSTSLLASSDNSIILPELNFKRGFDLLDSDCGDSLILKSGTSSKVQIIEVTETEILYKRCANLNGPVITMHKNDVARIRYANGNSETFETIKKNDLKKIIKGEKKFAKDTTSVVSLIFAALFLITWFLMMIGIVTKLLLLFYIGFIPTVILFFVTFFTALYALYQIKTDPENHTGKSKAGMALFILFFGALVAAVPLILMYMGLLVL